ncbi:MAG: sterol desaturase [Deltaproteobacteria bacterium CG11_big_fil_rev_8_21_14_0_20_45_16]|nr:MAG: sterol desaturase [Deltaproteobacteria bacterium CG11_big_fil_rev_8_21_14_0_20_45_16]
MASSAIVIVILCFVLIFILERIFPLRSKRRPLGHILVNAILTSGLLVTAYFFVRPSIENGFALMESMNFGLMSLMALPLWAEGILSFLLLDLSFYYWHRANHVIPFLWRLHNIHHVDPELDVTTAFRFHFGEVALSSGFRFFQVVLIGPSLAVFLVYEFVFQLGTLFHHSNIRLPRRLERYLNFLIVTPRMHTIHHSQVKEETNSNYSVVFKVWDSIHRTLRLGIPEERIKIGVPAYPEKYNRILTLIALPFRRQCDYWGTTVSQKPD